VAHTARADVRSVGVLERLVLHPRVAGWRGHCAVCCGAWSRRSIRATGGRKRRCRPRARASGRAGGSFRAGRAAALRHCATGRDGSGRWRTHLLFPRAVGHEQAQRNHLLRRTSKANVTQSAAEFSSASADLLEFSAFAGSLPSLGADVPGVSLVPADVPGVSPVPEQMWQGWRSAQDKTAMHLQD
jgi:hypothetical protein